MKTFYLLLISTCIASSAVAETILIKNTDIFDGESETILKDHDVLIRDNMIAEVGSNLDEAGADEVIDGIGYFLMPGMLDGHTHLSIIIGTDGLHELSWDEIGARMGKRAQATLSLGFTTVRDLGGPVFGLKKAIDKGLLSGPRIFPSGAFISQTSGHADFRRQGDGHPFFDGASSPMQELGWYRLVDGPDQVMAAVRENLRNGATQVKLMGSGGVGSEFDPIDSVQFRPEEIRAATEALADWGTYAASHLHNRNSIMRALENGVRSIEHASEMTDETMRLLKKKSAYMNPQYGWNVFVMSADFLNDFQREKAAIVIDNLESNVALIKKHEIEITFNTDAFGEFELWRAIYKAEFTERQKFFTNFEILRQATSVTAGLVEMSGKRNPYRRKLGVIREEAFADLILVNGDPMADVSLLTDENNIRLIMKNGKVFKNTL